MVTFEPLFQYHTVELTPPDLIAGLVVFVVFVRAIFRGFHSLPKMLLIPFIVFFFATGLSAIFAVDKIHAVAALFQELEFMALAWAFSIGTSAKTFLHIIHFLLGIFVFESLVGVGQFALGQGYPTGTFLVHQQYAFLTSVAALMAFALVSSETNRRRRLLYIIALSILLIGSLLGQERAPWLSFLVGGVAVAWYSGRKKRKRLLVGFGVTVLAAVLVVAAVPQLREVTTSRFAEAETDSYGQNSLLSRFLVWGIAFKLFTEHPVLGIGPKNFPTVIPHYASAAEMMGVEATDPHNVWLGLLAEQGVIGLVAYVYFFWAMIKLATSKLRTPLSDAAQAACLAYLAYQVFWFTMSLTYFKKGEGHIHFMMVGVMCGLYSQLTTASSSKLTPSIRTA
jgi:O-antigen ligase